MKRWAALGAFLGLCFFAAQARAADPLLALREAGSLGATAREDLTALLKSTPGGGACRDTLWACLSKSGADGANRRTAEFLARRLKAGQPRETVQREAAERAASFSDPPRPIDLGGLTPLGSPSAKVVVVVYADFECPACRQAAPALARAARERPTQVAYYFKNFPLKSHPHALPAAQAALAAQKLGRYYDFHDCLFAASDAAESAISACVGRLGLDAARFARERAEPGINERLIRDKTEGVNLGMQATPGVFINGRAWRGAKTSTELLARIADEGVL